MKIKIPVIHHSLGLTSGAGILFLLASGAFAQNMFIGNEGSHSVIEIPTTGPQSTFATSLQYPNALAFDSSGDLFVADEFSGAIDEYAPGGGAPTTFASGLNNPMSLAFDTAGDLFVGTQNNNILEYAVGGGPAMVFISGLSSPNSLAFDKAGNLFVVNQAGDVAGAGYVTKITPGKVQSTFASGFSNPNSLAFNAAGDLFVSSGNAGTITEITPGGTPTPFASGLNAPDGLAFDNQGDLFVTDAGVNMQNGDLTEFLAGGGENVTTPVSKPISIAFQGEMLPVPEPSVLGLVGVGIATLMIYRRKA